jgi:hypothetical protein
MSITTGTGLAESGDDSFGLLMDRLNSVIHRMKLAAGDLRAVADALSEPGREAATLVDAAKELAELCEDLRICHHDYTTARPVGHSQSQALTDAKHPAPSGAGSYGISR